MNVNESDFLIFQCKITLDGLMSFKNQSILLIFNLELLIEKVGKNECPLSLFRQGRDRIYSTRLETLFLLLR